MWKNPRMAKGKLPPGLAKYVAAKKAGKTPTTKKTTRKKASRKKK
jgi:hypothetical protein